MHTESRDSSENADAMEALAQEVLKAQSTDTTACLCFLGNTCKDKMEDNS